MREIFLRLEETIDKASMIDTSLRTVMNVHLDMSVHQHLLAGAIDLTDSDKACEPEEV